MIWHPLPYQNFSILCESDKIESDYIKIDLNSLYDKIYARRHR